MKLKEVFEKSIQFFKEKKIETARLDTELLLSYVLKIDRVQLYVKYEQPLTDHEITLCREVVRRRSQGEPVAYITNEKGFYGELFHVGKGVLIPRPETEMIVEKSIQFLNHFKKESVRVLDLASGSGCIGLSILNHLKNAQLVSIEKSKDAFFYLEKNTAQFNLQERTQLILGDIEEINFKQFDEFDLIVSNPPYIAKNDIQLEENVKKFEPALALFAEDQGLYFLKSWITKSKNIIRPGGVLFFELGSSQGQLIKNFALDLNYFSSIEIIKDLSGLDRIIKLVR